jgi:DNA-binding beta-propeller fold protein YncE
VTDLALSPDGQHAYVSLASGSGAVNALLVIDPNGGCVQAFQEPLWHQSDTHLSGARPLAGLQEPGDIAISPDGGHVYVVARATSSLFVFIRDAASGLLTPIQVLQDLSSFVLVPGAERVEGLAGLSSVVVSQSGTRVLAIAQGDRTLLNFVRETDGRLVLSQVLQDAAAPAIPGAIQAIGLGTPSFIDASPTLVVVGAASGLFAFDARASRVLPHPPPGIAGICTSPGSTRSRS